MDGGERRRRPDEVGSFGSPKGGDDASGKSPMCDAREIIRLKFSAGACDAGDRAASGRRGLDGQGDAEAAVDVRLDGRSPRG